MLLLKDEKIDQLSSKLSIMEERAKPIMFSAKTATKYGEQKSCTLTNKWLAFKELTEYRGGGFDTSSGTYTVPEDGLYIFGLQATSHLLGKLILINFYKNNADEYLVAFDTSGDSLNALGTTWTDTLKKGDKIRLKLDLGDFLDGCPSWWGVRIIANQQNSVEIRHWKKCLCTCLSLK